MLYKIRVKPTVVVVVKAFTHVLFLLQKIFPLCLFNKSNMAISQKENHTELAYLWKVTIKTANHPKPSETTRNHPKPSATTQNFLQPQLILSSKILELYSTIFPKLLKNNEYSYFHFYCYCRYYYYYHYRNRK